MRVRTLFLGSLLVLGLCGISGRALAQTATTETPAAEQSALPTAEHIVAKYVEATGDRDLVAKFTTRTVKGLYQTEDGSGFAGIEVISKAPNKRYTKISMSNGITVREICDGKSAWLEDPMGGVHPYTGAALESHLREAAFHIGGGLLALNFPGQVLGTAKIGAHSTYKVQFQPEKKYTLEVYFDTTSGLVVRADDIYHRDDGDYVVQVYMDDYRAVDGLNVPFKFRHVEKANSFTMRVQKIENNSPVDDSMFLKPATAANAQ